MRKKSNYKPKGIRLDVMTYVKSGLLPVAKVPNAGTTLITKNHAAFDEIMFGRATKEHVDVLIHAFNQAEAIAKLFPNKGGDWLPEIKEAQDAVYNMGKRWVNGSNFAFTGPELQAVKLAMSVHDQQLEETTVKELEQCIDYVTECIIHRRARVIARETA
jgi:hypothetical protein